MWRGKGITKEPQGFRQEHGLDSSDSRPFPLSRENMHSWACRFAGSGPFRQGLGQAEEAEPKLLQKLPPVQFSGQRFSAGAGREQCLVPRSQGQLRTRLSSPGDGSLWPKITLQSGLLAFQRRCKGRASALKAELGHLTEETNQDPPPSPTRLLDQRRTRRGQEQPPEKPEQSPRPPSRCVTSDQTSDASRHPEYLLSGEKG